MPASPSLNPLFLFVAFIGAGLLIPVSLRGGQLDVPPEDLEFDETAAERGRGTILKTKIPGESEGGGKWNSVTIRIPSDLSFQPGLRFRGTAKIEAAEAPTHFACLLTSAEGKTGLVMLKRAPELGENEAFVVTAADVKITPESKIDEPFHDRDRIVKLTVYASFPEPTDSKFTLQEFALLGRK